ncbi:uncharacterized protein KGF55_004365 [Candida pseudojiufengensis]|uniref:uncharacterized protein n=1 Tax=Candida pseudojiufengensis TaxID=497109 RepID=UPI002224956B|nr:uncharacterized protein KGF55_004365 [Candida pseudojiufengensis]KAI5960795.1 hypothetical protein KGF55_004365 [Candida pseudojiufengensis]
MAFTSENSPLSQDNLSPTNSISYSLDSTITNQQQSQSQPLQPSLNNLESDNVNNNHNHTDENFFLPAAYCFISNQKVYFEPIEDESEEDEDIRNNIADTFKKISIVKDDSDYLPDKLYLKNKNFLYSLNNPSVSDVETDTNNNNNTSTINSSGTYSNGNTLELPAGNNNTTFDSSANLSNSSSPSLTENSNKNSTSSIYFPKLVINLSKNLENGFIELKNLIMKVFPNWTDSSNLKITQVTGGITNMLLSCKYDNETILIRVYGHGTNLIIDRHREFISHLILNSIDLAPQVFARFKNGLVYGFLSGHSLKPEELSDSNIYPLIAQQLGNWHKSLNYKLIEEGVDKIRALKLNKRRNSFSKKKPSKKKRFISNIWELINDWIEIVPINPDLIDSFRSNLPGVEVNENNLIEVIKNEFNWLKSTLESVKSPIVSSHCDLLSGNVIIPDKLEDYQNLPSIESNPVKFIDYEYMLPAPRAFDIANHFAEWQGFDCDRTAIPEPSINNPVIVKWCKSYLNNSINFGEKEEEQEIEELVDEISMFYGLPGFYWGIWAMIQSELSNIDFNYSNYGKLRLEEYWDWKNKNKDKLKIIDRSNI